MSPRKRGVGLKWNCFCRPFDNFGTNRQNPGIWLAYRGFCFYSSISRKSSARIDKAEDNLQTVSNWALLMLRFLHSYCCIIRTFTPDLLANWDWDNPAAKRNRCKFVIFELLYFIRWIVGNILSALPAFTKIGATHLRISLRVPSFKPSLKIPGRCNAPNV